MLINVYDKVDQRIDKFQGGGLFYFLSKVMEFRLNMAFCGCKMLIYLHVHSHPSYRKSKVPVTNIGYRDLRYHKKAANTIINISGHVRAHD